MTLGDVINKINKTKPNSFSVQELTEFVNEVESIVYEYLGTEPNNRLAWEWPEDKEAELTVPMPYATLYEAYIKARIDQTNEEYELYQNNLAQFNADFEEYKAWAMRNGMVHMDLPKQITNWW